MGSPTAALGLSTLAMVVSFSVWAVLSPMASTLQEMFHLSMAQKGLLVATPVLLGSVMRIPMGILADRVGARKVYTLTMLSLVLPLLGAGVARSYATLLLFAFLIGMAGTTFAVAIAYVSPWFPLEKQGLVLGITGMGNIGTAVAAFTVPSLVEAYGVPRTFHIFAAAIALTTLLFWTGTRDRAPRSPGGSLPSLRLVLRYQQTWLLSMFYFLTFGSFVAFSMYLPTLLQDQFRLSAVDAGLRAAGFAVLATLARPVGGYLADRFGAEGVLAVVLAGVLACAVVTTVLSHALLPFSVAVLTVALLVGAGNGAVFKLVPLVARGHTGAVAGVVGAAGGLGGFFPPVVLGLVRDATGSYAPGFGLLAAFTLGCLLLEIRHFARRNLWPTRRRLTEDIFPG